MCVIGGAATQCVGDDRQFGDSVGPVFEDSKRRLWVSASTGAWRWQPDRAVVFARRGDVSAWTETADGVVLAAREGRLWQVGGASAERFPIALLSSGTEPTITTLLTDRSRAIWIGTLEHGLFHRHADGRVDSYTRLDGLSGNTVTSLFEDREGNVWVATNNGIDRFRALSASTYCVAQGVSGRVGSVLADRDQSVWASSALGLYRLRDNRTSVYRKQPLKPGSPVVKEIIVPNLPDPPVGALYQDRRGRVWLGAAAGLGYFDDTRFVRVAGRQRGSSIRSAKTLTATCGSQTAKPGCCASPPPEASKCSPGPA